MPSRLALLLLAAAVLGCAHASRELAEDFTAAESGRQLLQTPTSADCDRSVKHCDTCRYQFYRGTVTKAICTKCETGYVVKNSGRACYCAPGYYTSGDTSVDGQTGFTCAPCGPDAWCPGAKVTAVSSKVRYSCGTNKITTTEYAKSDRECVVKPGFGWAAGDDSVECPQGFYNPGYNTRKCTKCPGSLTTLGTNSNSTQDCQAPSGYYYLRGKAVACARGTYKSYIGNNDCDECPTGMSTPANAVAQTDKLTCNVVLAGYSLAATPSLGVTDAEECPQDTYRNGEATGIVDQQAGSVDCVACGDNMVTLPNVTRATTSDACVVPPGYGWVAPVSGTKGTAVKCAVGWYNPGYNREPCIKCGNGTITTEAQGSTSADQCYTPAGNGNRRDPVTGTLEGYVCPLNTYGRADNTYGLVDVECTKCLENSHTNDVGSTGQAQCLTNAGYGWDDGQVNQCDYGYYNPGNNTNKCEYCGDFYNTTNAASSANGELGSDSIADCKLDLGYQAGTAAGTIEPCLRGWYKDTVSMATCTQCPAGTSTTITLASVAETDCDVCRPGFGAATADGKIDLAGTIGCTICGTGTYSSGFVQGGQNCAQCPQAQNFTSGEMVSRQGASSPEECFGEFITDADNEQNFLWWDIIDHDSATLVSKPALTNLADCQNGCGSDPECQYMEFYKSGPTAGCYWRAVSGASITALNSRISGATAAWWNAPTGLTGGIVMFEIREGSYVVYPKTATEVIGTTLDLSALGAAIGDFKATRTACDKAPDCIGLTWDSTSQWRAFKGALWEDAIGKVRVVGNAINSWVAIPSGTEEPEGWSNTNP